MVEGCLGLWVLREVGGSCLQERWQKNFAKLLAKAKPSVELWVSDFRWTAKQRSVLAESVHKITALCSLERTHLSLVAERRWLAS